MKLSKESISLGMAKMNLYAQMMYLLGDVLSLFREMALSFEDKGESAKLTKEMYDDISNNIVPQIADIFEKEEVLERKMDREFAKVAQEEETFH